MHVWLHFMSSVDKRGSSTFHVLEWPPSPPFVPVYKTRHLYTHIPDALRLGDYLVHDCLVKLIVGEKTPITQSLYCSFYLNGNKFFSFCRCIITECFSSLISEPVFIVAHLHNPELKHALLK